MIIDSGTTDGPLTVSISLSIVSTFSLMLTSTHHFQAGQGPDLSNPRRTLRFTTGHSPTLLQEPKLGNQRRHPPPQNMHLLPDLFVFIFLLLPAADHKSAAGSQLNIATDLAALLAFKSQADPGGKLSNSWTVNRRDNADFCSSWGGIACGLRHQRVTELSLPLASLAGTIPPHIGNLSFLVSLDLSNNKLTGPLPAVALARLHRLRYLNLSSNQLTGSLPAELGGLPQLREIRLGDNKLHGEIPPSLGDLPQLMVFDLPRNMLSGTIPDRLSRLPNLQKVNLQMNILTGAIPGEMFRMASLRALTLTDNRLSGSIPEQLHLPNITYLSLSRNELGGRIPRALGLLSTLQSLYLSGNAFTGNIPPELGNLTNLQDLYLSENPFTGNIPPDLGNLTNLQSFIIEGAQVAGEIPPELGKLANLQFFSVARNMLTGGFPTAVYNMSSLETLVLSNNSLSGSLPSDLGRRLPPKLEGFFVNMNKFNGEIPGSLSNASVLSILELSYNQFEGSVPPELGALQELVNLTVTDNSFSGRLDFLAPLSRCRKLQQLNLRNNRFNGTLPESAIGNFTNLESFVGQGNVLQGGIPPTFGNLTNLTTLVLSYNMLSGPIPPAIVVLPKLERLYLEVNRLEGRIPPEIGRAKKLGLLYLHVNNLSGPLPNSLGNLTAMQQMNLAENKLASTLPPGLWQLTDITELSLSHNLFVGSLPGAVKSLTKVTQLDLSTNQLSGRIPDVIVEMQMLTDLSLASNNLSGPLPTELGSMLSLATLDLSSNALSGKIPPSMAKLRYLECLNLSFNNLEGEIPEVGIFAWVSPGISKDSFAGNLALCGAPWFGLPPCKEPKGKGMKHVYIAILAPVAAATTFLVIELLVFFLLAKRRKKITKKKRNPPCSLADDDMVGHPMISQHELGIATDGFSEANLIGAGGYGKVYRGRLGDGTEFAVKVLDLQKGEAAWRSFDAECRVMRAVRHRNLVGIITTCSNPYFRALVLPLMPNGSLDMWLHHGDGSRPQLSLLQRVAVAVDVASALEYLHHGCPEPVVHCDVKPNNVLLDAQMVAHLGDFGIAKEPVAEHSRSITRTSMPGTFGYMAPEYGTAGRVTTKGDVYSYGILLLEAVTGVRPTDPRFVGDMNLRRWVASAFPDAVASVIENCLLHDQPEEPCSSSSSSSNRSKNTSSSGIRHDGGCKGHYGEWPERERRRSRCLVAVIELGLVCSSESPKERPDMVEVATRVWKIREELPSSS